MWELAKLDRRGAPTGLLRLEFEAACCLVSLALFENLAALDRRALDARDASEPAREDPRLRKRLRYATRGMYWKFRAFHVTARPNANRGSRGDEHVDAIAPTAIAPTAIAPTSDDDNREDGTVSVGEDRTISVGEDGTVSTASERTARATAPIFRTTASIFRTTAPISVRADELSVDHRVAYAGGGRRESVRRFRTRLARRGRHRDGFERAHTFAVDDRAGCASWDWDVGENSRPSGGVAFGSMDFSGERLKKRTA